MRARATNGEISVHAIAGTEVVLLGLDATEAASKDLLGFRILKRKGKSGAFRPLSGGRDFEGVKSATPLIQGFLWGDYVVNSRTAYTYRVAPVHGDPKQPSIGNEVEVSITTEDPAGDVHGVYFNRGVAGSQAYSEWFGKYRKWFKKDPNEADPAKIQFDEFLRPEDVPDRAAYKWLSRGLEEGMLDFIGQARGPQYSLRAAVYELTYRPVIQAFVDALESGADVTIVHHAKPASTSRLKRNTNADTTVVYKDGITAPQTFKSNEVVEETSGDDVTQAANRAVAEVGISDEKYLDAFRRLLIPRTITQISHNKFIVLLKDGKPVQVWTGSTNLTAGGIFGQSNVGHVVRDPDVAGKYFKYWQKLATNPKKKSAAADPPSEGIQNWTVNEQPDLSGPPAPNSITPVFSPRLTKAMLDWYADRLDAAESSVFFTAAFSVADEIFAKVVEAKKVAAGKPYLRFLLLEGIGGLLAKKYPVMAKVKQNRIAWGDIRKEPGGEEKRLQFIETLTGLNDHVNYLHTKYMLIDPLSDDPVVISGSANFSTASTVDNDENMLIIRGNTRIADIFLVEFMRLFKHFQGRNEYNRLSGEQKLATQYHDPTGKWRKPYYTNGTAEEAERKLFS